MSPSAMLLQLCSALLLANAVLSKPEDWAPAQEEHWASAGCTLLTAKGSHYALHNEECHTCVDKTKGHGDPTRCHQCLKHHHGHLPAELVEVCLECVPTAETKRLGWACGQYCTHHGIINDRSQAEDCIDCLMVPVPKDKWSCHVCMEQVDKDMDARRDCYQCLKDGMQMYGCAYCGRVPGKVDRAACFQCMKGGRSGEECAAPYGIQRWVKETKPEGEMKMIA